MSSEYSLLPLPVVIKMVTSLENLRLSLFYSIETLEWRGQDTNEYLLSILRMGDNYMKYIIILAPKLTPSTIATVGDDVVEFIGVNYAEDGTLLQSYIMPNAVKCPITIIRSQVELYWRSVFYTFTYNVPDVDRRREIKQSLINIFVFPSTTFVLFGRSVLHFTFIEQFFVPTYIGLLNDQDVVVDSIIEWDWADGLLVGTIDGQSTYMWNTQFFAITNQLPNLYQVPLKNQKIVLGGNFNYYLEYRDSTLSEPILVKSSYAHKLSAQTNELIGQLVDFVSLREFVLIDNTQLYIIAFSNVLSTDSLYDAYALIGSADFINTDSSLVTTPARVEYTTTYDDTYQQYGLYFFFKYLAEDNVLIVYRLSFRDFLATASGRIVISDLRTKASTATRLSFRADQNTDRAFTGQPSAHELANVTNGDNSFVEPWRSAAAAGAREGRTGSKLLEESSSYRHGTAARVGSARAERWADAHRGFIDPTCIRRI